MVTKIINYYAGPGAGKSTTAAHTFALLKQRGYNAELVTEYAKDLVWDECRPVLGDQLYLFAEQYHRIWRLLGKVPFIVTDSPLLLSLHYGQNMPESFKELVWDTYESMDNIDVYLERVKPYQPVGRNHDEQQAREIDVSLRAILRGRHLWLVPGDEQAALKVVQIALQAH